MVQPSEWLPIVFGDHDAGYKSLEEADAVLGELMALCNVLNDEVGEDRASLPADCVFRTETLADLESDAAVAEWSRGFLRGHQWLEESWEARVPGDLEDEFSATLMTLSVFASKELPEAFVAELRQDVKAMADRFAASVPTRCSSTRVSADRFTRY